MRRRIPILLFCLCPALLALIPFEHFASAQTATGRQTIHSVFVAPSSRGAVDQAVRARLMERLKKSGVVSVAENAGSADAILHSSAVIWQTGQVSTNARSRSVKLTNYEGYLSAELSDASNRTIWSYLATPSRFRMSNIVDDLSDRLSVKLIASLKTGLGDASSIPAAGASAGSSLKVAGATFPAPLYRKWFESFAEDAGGFPIHYDAVGSVAGLEQLAAAKVDMAASDIPATGDSVSGAGKVLYFPAIVGGVVPIYNLPGEGRTLNLTPQVLADIYSGKIRKWNDARVRQWNGGIHLPDAEIQVVHRSDGSGTTYAWTRFLAKASPEWSTKAGASVEWPVGMGAAGNDGIADKVAATRNAIGYVELTYAIQHRLSYAAVQNPAGRFIKADLDSINAAASDAHALDSSIMDGAAGNAYPITTFTWLIVPETGGSPQQRAAMGKFLHWMLTTGQRECSVLGYAPLPREIVAKELQAADGLK